MGTQTENYKEKALNGRIEEIERIRTLNSRQMQEDSNVYDYRDDEDHREPLSIDTRIEKTILLSWGGGSDGFKLYFNEEKELISGVYFVANWGVYEESELSFDEAEEVYNFYMGGYLE